MNQYVIKLDEKKFGQLTATLTAARLVAFDESQAAFASMEDKSRALDISIEIAELEKHILEQIIDQIDENKPKSTKKHIKVQF